MEFLLFLIYSFFVWLVIFKFKWLPWNLTTQIITGTIPLVALTVLILLLNIVAPSSHDVRVYNYVVQIIPQVAGRVAEVPVEPNRPVKKGDLLFRIDPTPFELEVRRIRAQLALAETRLKQSSALARRGAGSKLDMERDQSDARQLSAQLDKAEWDLAQTVVRAPADGIVVNLQLRAGAMAVTFPIAPAMSFIEKEDQRVIALYRQNELRKIAPGDEAELAMETYPGRIIKGKVDSIVWAIDQGFAPFTMGRVPSAGAEVKPEERFAVKIVLDGKDKDLFLAAGAQGRAAIYTQHLKMVHIIRKVTVRVGSKLNWFILKLH